MRVRRVVAAAFVAAVGVLAVAPVAGAAPTPHPQPLPSGPAVTGGKRISVPRGSISFALGTSNGSVGDGRSRFTWSIRHGGTTYDYAIAYNLSATPLTLKVLAVDGVTDSSGTLTPAADHAPKLGVGRWIQPLAPYVSIPAHRSVIIPFRISVPQNATPGDHGGAFVLATIPSQTTSGGKTTVHQEARIGMPAYVRVLGPLHTTIAITSLTGAYHANNSRPGFGDLTVKYSLVNTGNVRVSVDQKFVAKGLLGLPTLTQTPATIGQILPGSRVSGLIVFRNVPGVIRLTLTDTATPSALDPGSPIGTPVSRSTTIIALSWAGALALTAGVGIIAAAVIFGPRLFAALMGAFGFERKKKPATTESADKELTSVGSSDKTGN